MADYGFPPLPVYPSVPPVVQNPGVRMPGFPAPGVPLNPNQQLPGPGFPGNRNRIPSGPIVPQLPSIPMGGTFDPSIPSTGQTPFAAAWQALQVAAGMTPPPSNSAVQNAYGNLPIGGSGPHLGRNPNFPQTTVGNLGVGDVIPTVSPRVKTAAGTIALYEANVAAQNAWRAAQNLGAGVHANWFPGSYPQGGGVYPGAGKLPYDPSLPVGPSNMSPGMPGQNIPGYGQPNIPVGTPQPPTGTPPSWWPGVLRPAAPVLPRPGDPPPP